MMLNDVMSIILHYLTIFASFGGNYFKAVKVISTLSATEK